MDSEDHNVVYLVSSRVVSLLLYSTYLRVHIIFVISYFVLVFLLLVGIPSRYTIFIISIVNHGNSGSGSGCHWPSLLQGSLSSRDKGGYLRDRWRIQLSSVRRLS